MFGFFVWCIDFRFLFCVRFGLCVLFLVVVVFYFSLLLVVFVAFFVCIPNKAGRPKKNRLRCLRKGLPGGVAGTRQGRAVPKLRQLEDLQAQPGGLPRPFAVDPEPKQLLPSRRDLVLVQEVCLPFFSMVLEDELRVVEHARVVLLHKIIRFPPFGEAAMKQHVVHHQGIGGAVREGLPGGNTEDRNSPL